MSRSNQVVQTVTKSPVLWGGLGSIGFYALIQAGPLGNPLIVRYFTHHPVEYMTTLMFMIGLASLLIKAFDVLGQQAELNKPLFGSVAKTLQPVEEADALLERLDRLPGRRQSEYYVCRLRAGLEHVRHRGSAESLDDELKYLADVDAARLHSGYALFRVIVWAIPILGFLGTVIGITMALNGIDLQSPDQSMYHVLNGLGLKFDTTALALTLAIVLMFVHYPVERVETALLEAVDRRVQQELADRFPAVPTDGDGQIVAMRSIAQTVLQATDVLVRRQAELWQTSVDVAAGRWAQMAEVAGGHVKTAMSAAVGELTSRAEVLERAVAATGEVTRLEGALNHNLAALAGAKHFQETVLSLAAAVNMLSARLADTPDVETLIHLEPTKRSANAA